MKDFLFFFFVLSVFYLYASLRNVKANKKETVPVEPVCPPHKWQVYDQPGMENITYTKCLICNKTPTEILEEM